MPDDTMTALTVFDPTANKVEATETALAPRLEGLDSKILGLLSRDIPI
jgi:hypothetical protein